MAEPRPELAHLKIVMRYQIVDIDIGVLKQGVYISRARSDGCDRRRASAHRVRQPLRQKFRRHLSGALEDRLRRLIVSDQRETPRLARRIEHHVGADIFMNVHIGGQFGSANSKTADVLSRIGIEDGLIFGVGVESVAVVLKRVIPELHQTADAQVSALGQHDGFGQRLFDRIEARGLQISLGIVLNFTAQIVDFMAQRLDRISFRSEAQ